MYQQSYNHQKYVIKGRIGIYNLGYQSFGIFKIYHFRKVYIVLWEFVMLKMLHP